MGLVPVMVLPVFSLPQSSPRFTTVLGHPTQFCFALLSRSPSTYFTFLFLPPMSGAMRLAFSFHVIFDWRRVEAALYIYMFVFHVVTQCWESNNAKLLMNTLLEKYENSWQVAHQSNLCYRPLVSYENWQILCKGFNVCMQNIIKHFIQENMSFMDRI